jgi:hypothetical protein
MSFDLLADTVVLLHLTFVVFVIVGGLLVLRCRAVAWLHVPAVIWAVLLQVFGWVCPLTPLEKALRLRAGEAAYGRGFVEHYIIPVLYPAAVTRTSQVVMGMALLLVNAAVYGWLVSRRSPAGDRID